MKDAFDQPRRFGTGQAKPPMDDIREIGAGQRSVDAHFLAQPRDPKIRHGVPPAIAGAPPPAKIDYTFVTEFIRVGNATFDELPIFFNI